MKVVFVEKERCLACRNCERVCSFQEAGGFNRENSNIWVQIDMDNRTIFTITCLQCDEAACLKICPAKAIRRDPHTHAVVVDETLCVGCRMCVFACPFGCMHYENHRQVAAKCNLCGGDPQCVKNCMARALHFADINKLANMKRNKVDQAFVKTAFMHEGEGQLRS